MVIVVSSLYKSALEHMIQGYPRLPTLWVVLFTLYATARRNIAALLYLAGACIGVDITEDW